MSVDVEIFNYQTYNVSSGQTDIGDMVDYRGTLNVLFDGTISNTTDYGTVNVSSGGTAIGITIEIQGVQTQVVRQAERPSSAGVCKPLEA
jgi:hypothetical protein